MVWDHTKGDTSEAFIFGNVLWTMNSRHVTAEVRTVFGVVVKDNGAIHVSFGGRKGRVSG